MASGYEQRPWTKHYQIGRAHPSPTATALELWRRAVVTSPDAPAVHFFNETLTRRQVDDRASSLAAALLGRGLPLGGRVGIYLQSDPEWLIALLAVWKAGGIAVALNPMFKERELAYHLSDSGAQAVICLDELYRYVKGSMAEGVGVNHVVLVSQGNVSPNVGSAYGGIHVDAYADLTRRRGPIGLPKVEVKSTDIAILTYTSGTTGIPKGTTNTQGNIAYSAAVAAAWFGLGPSDVILGVAPLFHITGIVLHMALSWATGAALILFHRFDPGEALRLAEKWHATFAVGSITAFSALLNHPDLGTRDISSLRTFASGGAPISQATLDRFQTATGRYIHNVYGLSETTSPSHLVPIGVHAPTDSSGAVSVGLPVPGSISRVLDLETGEEAPVGDLGEIVIEGPMVIPGYWQKPDETRHAIPGGRLHTGDVGYMNSDGWFFVIDRAKDQINTSGNKVWPREVEDALYEHPAVREASVVGVPDPDRGETVKAYVSLVAGISVEPDQLVAFCRERLAVYKCPRSVEILDELPKTLTGKFLRRELRNAGASG